MKNLILSSLVFLMSVSVFSKTLTKSVYTDLKTDCIVVSDATENAQIDFYESECKAFGGYTLRESGGDLRYGPELAFQGKVLNLQRPSVFHNLGSSKIEWIYDLVRDEVGSGSITFKALIYRLSVATNPDSSEDKSILYAVRLDGKNTCVIGTTSTNEEAHKLANNTAAKCVTLNR